METLRVTEGTIRPNWASPGGFYLYPANTDKPCVEVSGDGTLVHFDLEGLKAVAESDESAGCVARALLAVYTQGKLER